MRILLDELGEYDPELLTRPRVVVGTKTDMADPDLVAAWDGPVISSITRQGVRELVGRLASLVHEARDSEPKPKASDLASRIRRSLGSRRSTTTNGVFTAARCCGLCT